jgi:hypothetical protein
VERSREGKSYNKREGSMKSRRNEEKPERSEWNEAVKAEYRWSNLCFKLQLIGSLSC